MKLWIQDFGKNQVQEMIPLRVTECLMKINCSMDFWLLDLMKDLAQVGISLSYFAKLHSISPLPISFQNYVGTKISINVVDLIPNHTTKPLKDSNLAMVAVEDVNTLSGFLLMA
jgi:hypothetical protein